MASPLNWFAQIASITLVNLMTIAERKGASAAATFGIAGVVAVLVGVLSIAQGFRRTMTHSGSPDTVIVMRGGSDSEMMSILVRDETRIIADAPQVAQTPEGPAASAELFVVINLPKRSTGTDANVPLRGVEAAAFHVRDRLRIVQGRRFETGRNEIIVGVGAAREFAGLDLDARLRVGKNEWSVVGIFEADGGIDESEIWTDAGVLQSAYQRGNSFQAAYVKLKSPDLFDSFKDTLTSDPRLNPKIIHQAEYYEEQSRMVTGMITGLGFVVAGLMATGAVFGALNTMFTAVSARTREIATLRALGFGGLPVIISVLIESMALALVGGAIGGALAYFAFDGFRAATINWQSFSQVAFAFDVTPGLVMLGITLASLIGLIGGIFPAIRAARLPIAAALRDI